MVVGSEMGAAGPRPPEYMLSGRREDDEKSLAVEERNGGPMEEEALMFMAREAFLARGSTALSDGA